MIEIKEVRSERSGLVGWEIWACGKLFLVWADQGLLEGLRLTGDDNRGFCPNIGDTLTQSTLFTVGGTRFAAQLTGGDKGGRDPARPWSPAGREHSRIDGEGRPPLPIA